MPQLSKREVRHLISHMHTLDADGDGMVSFLELAAALHALDLKLPSKATVRGGQFKRAKAAAGGAATAAAAGGVRGRRGGAGGEPELMREWVLEAFTDPDNGKQLLLDEGSAMLYLPPDKEEKWPRVFGVLDGDTVVRGQAPLLQVWGKCVEEENVGRGAGNRVAGMKTCVGRLGRVWGKGWQEERATLRQLWSSAPDDPHIFHIG